MLINYAKLQRAKLQNQFKENKILLKVFLKNMQLSLRNDFMLMRLETFDFLVRTFQLYPFFKRMSKDFFSQIYNCYCAQDVFQLWSQSPPDDMYFLFSTKI